MIYIVEDDRNIQEIELFALKNSGYQAVGFETAKEFYKRAFRKAAGTDSAGYHAAG